MNDPINPKHYKHLPAEAIDIIEAAIERAPTNAAAYLQGQALKYLLRCWEKKGIEDLRKAKWYLDRLVNQSSHPLAEGLVGVWMPSDRTPKPSKTQPPSDDTEIPQGWRELEPDEFPSVGDKFAVDGKWVDLSSSWTVSYGYAPSKQLYIRKIETPSDKPTPRPSKTQPPSGYRLLGPAKDEPRTEGDLYWSLAIKGWTVLASYKVEYANRDDWAACRKIETPTELPNRYREPTQADLRNGPIDCEVRNSDGEQWVWRILCRIADGSDLPFRVLRDRLMDSKAKFPQCRIEVTE